MVRALRIKDFPDYYITDTGDVYSRHSDKYHNPNNRIKKLKPFVSKNGYKIATLTNNGKTYRKLVHRLVAETFVPNPKNKPEVNHIDGNTLNNRVENLEFVTKSENELHKFRILKKGHYLGADNWNARRVAQIKDGKIIKTFGSIREAERITEIKNTNISACCREKSGYKTAGGYQWKRI